LNENLLGECVTKKLKPYLQECLNCLTSKIEELLLFIPSFKAQVEGLEKHKTYLVNK
jgi:hypothetical protein